MKIDEDIPNAQIAMIQEAINGEYDHELTKLITKTVRNLVLLCYIYIQIENYNSGK